ncbi:MAG: UDP-N-acetylglucosamine 1-carboxyvinyltransferase, partial [Clostridiales bacterium]|nr:UDP-N-acetylglucosamine 1-carboxyvinyltransferase [Clostridiales bacterium]
MSTEGTWRITGGRRLHGEVTVHAAKNAVLPILAACLLTERPVTLVNTRPIRDVT